MTKIKKLLAAVAMMALVTLGTGCSHTKQVGRIGDLEIYKVSLRGLDTPNITALATRNVQDNSVNFITSANGAGLGPALVSAVGGAGAAAVNGVSLRPSSTRINSNTSSDGGNSTSTGGAGGVGTGYGSAGATSSSASQSGSYSESSSWSGVIGSGNVNSTQNNTTTPHGNNGNGGNPHNN